jgi:hypothetical protein
VAFLHVALNDHHRPEGIDRCTAGVADTDLEHPHSSSSVRL